MKHKGRGRLRFLSSGTPLTSLFSSGSGSKMKGSDPQAGPSLLLSLCHLLCSRYDTPAVIFPCQNCPCRAGRGKLLPHHAAACPPPAGQKPKAAASHDHFFLARLTGPPAHLLLLLPQTQTNAQCQDVSILLGCDWDPKAELCLGGERGQAGE